MMRGGEGSLSYDSFEDMNSHVKLGEHQRVIGILL